MFQLTRALATVCLVASITAVQAAGPETSRWFTNAENQVLDGYDVVAYQSTDKADPAKYAPSFGGYCAFAMGNAGQKVPANLDTFKMHNGKLLVFFNNMYKGKKSNTKIPWNGA
jgi:hypothetical protein